MRILWVATKAPWPPVDGGRLLLLNTLRALSSAGHQVTLVAPIDTGDAERIAAGLGSCCRPSLVAVRRRPLLVDALRSQLARVPLTIVRHTLSAVTRRVAEHLREEGPVGLPSGGPFDLIQAEQVQALSSIRPGAGLPVVFRAQNVESDLWAQSARQASWRRPLLELEARRLAAWEGRAVRRCATTHALTAEDAERLGTLAGLGTSAPLRDRVTSAPLRDRVTPAPLWGDNKKVHHTPAPFEQELPAASEPLPGSPPVVLFGSGGWRPNAAGAGWFLSDVWPRMLSARPEAVLHVFGIETAGPAVQCHPPPADSRDAYPRGGVLVVPLKIASGVRIKILEAWARGVPVIATPEAARGLEAEDEEQLLLARDGEAFAGAVSRLADPECRVRLVENGRRHLRRRHDASRIAERLTGLYEELIG